MLPLHTQKSLDALTWNEIQKLHTSLGLKATAATRTRRDYQKRIVEAMPQPIAEVEQIATPLTCATCPFAILLDTNRYECGARVTHAVTGGHWEAKTDCYDAVAAQAQTETTEPAAEVAHQETATETESSIAHQKITEAQPEQYQVTAQPAPKTFNHPFRYRADIFNGQHSFSSATYGLCECDRCVPVAQPTIPVTPGTVATTTDDALPNCGDNGRGRVTASTALQAATIVTRESEDDRKFNDLAYFFQLELEAQLAIERTVIGSEEEAIAYRHLRSIEEDIKYYGQPKPEPQPSPVIQQLETQMKELKADVLKLFKIEPFDQSILPTETDEPEQSATQSKPEPEGTIHWTTPQRGVIVGKKGAIRQFYIRNDEIFIVLSGEFTASETKHPNIRHRQIREAINLGRTFNPRIFKVSLNFERDTQVCNGGRIRQECDGRWWAWADGGITGHPFLSENLATQYLERVAANKQAQKQTPCMK